MYSTKNIEKILLAELTRQQYDTFMKDVKDSTGLYFKQIRNIRNSETFRKVFGNKQRIWIPLNVIDKPQKIYLTDYMSESDIKYTQSNCIENLRWLMWYYYLLMAKEDYKNIDDVHKYLIDLRNKNFEKRYSREELTRMFINGKISYFDINGKEHKNEKIGKLYTKLINMYEKSNFEESYKEFMLDDLKRWQNEFLSRLDNTKWFPTIFIKAYSDNYKDKLYICISRYPADVAAMSTGQGWSSCQNLDHAETKTRIDYDENNWHVKYDISLGTCVAYLITESNIKRSEEKQNIPTKYDKRFEKRKYIPKTSLFPLLSPMARIAIKPFYNKNNEIYLSIGTNPMIYGTTNTNEQIFIETVKQFLEERQENISGEFNIPPLLYNESVGNANAILVKNGKIVTTLGERDMLRNEPNKKD